MFFKNQRIGKYEILDTIGTGGFGSVYLAQDIMISKKVAIKVPHKQGEDQEKLLQEPRMLASLNHPNIVSVITAEKQKDVFFIVMEYIDGYSLEQYLRRNKRVAIDLALGWFIKLVDAIVYAHAKNVIHRDIRPANVLISKEGQVKLGDLGTSRFLEGNRFASTRIGSPPYMAPEHFQGKATFQSDIYSFGVMMYECLTGTLPFFDKDPLRLAKLAREKKAKTVHELNNQVSPELSHIIQRAMFSKLSGRYPSAKLLLEDLQRVRNRPKTEHLSQDLAHLVAPDFEAQADKIPVAASSTAHYTKDRLGQALRGLRTKEFSDLFCWNCSRPIQKRANVCPHCGETQR
jgi:serine/threonine-protein kinase